MEADGCTDRPEHHGAAARELHQLAPLPTADALRISISTVKTHLASLMRELSARNRVEIAM